MSKAWFLLLALLCAAALTLSVWWMLRPARFEPGRPQSAALYLLRDSGGRLALCQEGSGEPIALYDVYTRLLPEEDVLRLQEGIPVRDAEELQRLLEDFGL